MSPQVSSVKEQNRESVFVSNSAKVASFEEKNKEMEQLGNAFSVLELDVDDIHLQSLPIPGSSKKKVNDNAETSLVMKEKQNLVTPSSEYKFPLVWIDLEMTGLNIEVDRILEIACIITDGNLAKTVEGPDLVIHQTEECLEKMGEWCQSHHEASGLTKKVLESTISEKEAEKQVIEFVKRYTGSYTPLLAGNSVYVDFQFLKKYMPELASLFSHVVVDVSSVNALCMRWYPKDKKKAPAKEKRHRALDDIRESIEELRYYKANIFKSKSNK